LSRMLCDLILTTDEACIYYCNLEDWQRHNQYFKH
jgi:hypothetical protein